LQLSFPAKVFRSVETVNKAILLYAITECIYHCAD